jgi:casein kinase II subunit alpha
MGTESLRDYLRKYKLNLPSQCAQLIKACEAVPFEDFVSDRNKDRVSVEAFDLLRKMLVYDKNMRITPRDALKHAYFEPIRAMQN